MSKDTGINPLELEEILEDVFSAGEVQMASIQTGKKLPKNYADNRLKEAVKAINAHLYKEVKSLLPEREKLSDYTLNMHSDQNPPSDTTRTNLFREGYNKAIEDMEAAAQRKYGGSDQ